MKWIIPSNLNYYKANDAFKKNNIVYWRQKVNYKVGDIIYIYSVRPVQKVMLKTHVLETNVAFEDTYDDSEFFVHKEDIYDNKTCKSVKLELIKYLDDERLNLDNLMKNGLKGAPQGPMKLRDSVLEEYIESCFEEDEITEINKKNLNYEREVISIPASGKIDLIYKCRIHAHPDNFRSYPYKKALYYTFRRKGGIMEKLYTNSKTIRFNPNKIEEIKQFNLNKDEIQRLECYVRARAQNFGFSEEGNYKFYILDQCLELEKCVSLPKQNNHAYFTISEMYSKKEIISRYNENDGKSDEKYTEGAMTTIQVNKYERNPKARKKCLEYYGYKCCICGFDFEKFYGYIGKNIIEVHHKKALNEIKNTYEVDPIKDLRPVCSNCHTIIHNRKPDYEIEELKSIITQKHETIQI
ncbi:HNH endonuclease [Clostridium butyricum]|uniref:HNH endonuclease domain protein n=1 Tax=Clostridium butyricum E4 str. BoNT E BL5262 TaxID=632245 RepID=C4IFW3_CLOBU|nr:HNH endonuclease [Clostridium butyricum]EDT75927.1 HNH endonuclease domain protein [Clostridium butyricum 5521]EEP54461.1 HNH endonuclease domain protein [Clostridium butyricum E4 str. BoNT E BL5262]NFL30469.1 HNH endonuclease [Clostridium butyricum]NFS17241.1 HNH endonuclease [Clostridium butyricum]